MSGVLEQVEEGTFQGNIDLVEYCQDCERDLTEEEVFLRIVQEGAGENAKYSNEPYRVLECDCGTTYRERINKGGWG